MRILSFTFILCLLVQISFGQAEQQKKLKPKRTDNYIRMRGIRIGVDVTRPFQNLWTKGNRYGSEFSADLELWPNWFPVFESGYEFMKIKTNYIDFGAQGSYSRLGIDYNFLQAHNKNEKDILYFGLRYAFTLAHQQIDEWIIDSYWGPYSGKFASQNYFAHWGEFLVGIKGEIVKNLYMGWTVRGKVSFNQKNVGFPPTYFIPGYGKAEKGFNMDFTYSVYYNIPWDFRKKKVQQTGTTAIDLKKKVPGNKPAPIKKPQAKGK